MGTLSENERVALHTVAQALIEIRSVAKYQGNTEEIEGVLKYIHDLADSVHNIPSVVAGKNENLSYLFHLEVNECSRVLKDYESIHLEQGNKKD